MDFMMNVVCHKSHIQTYSKLPNQLVRILICAIRSKLSYFTLQSGYLPSALVS